MELIYVRHLNVVHYAIYYLRTLFFIRLIVYSRFKGSCYLCDCVGAGNISSLVWYTLCCCIPSELSVQDYAYAKVKVKHSLNKSWRLRGGMECWTSILTLTCDTDRTAELSAVRADRTLLPSKFLGIHSC